ncbi:MAG: S41 family peptidase [Acidimicrobiales bacterium]
MLAEAYYADRIDEPTWRSEASQLEGRDIGSDERHEFVRRLLVALGDEHSSFFTPSERGPTANGLYLPPTGEVDDQGVGRLRLPGLATGPEDTDTDQGYVAEAHEVLTGDACGWVLDLRGDNGGNLFAMLVAIGPLVGPGPAVSYRHRNGDTDTYDITSTGSLIAEDGTILAQPASTARFTPDLPIAVLQGPSTASAGEGVVMAMRGRGNVVSLGRPTAGIPTGNSVFEFTDGSAVNLTVAIGIDNEGVAHEGPIPPDITTDTPDTDAATWLLNQPNCQTPQ